MSALEPSAEIAAMKIVGVVSKRSHRFELLLSQLERAQLASICINIRDVFDWNFNFQEFYKNLCSNLYLPLELLWSLHIFQIMPFEIYLIAVYSHAEIFMNLENNIFFLCSEANEDIAFFVQSGILSYLVSKSFPVVQEDEHGEKLKEICLALVKSVIQGVFCSEEKDILTKRLSAFLALWNSGTLDKTSLHRFCSHLLLYFLQLHPVETDVDAYQVLENVRDKTAPFHLQFILEKAVKILTTTEIVHILESAAIRSDTNWKSYIVIVSSYLAVHKDAVSSISKLVSSFQKEAYGCYNLSLLGKSLLISRQAALTSDSPLHISHKQWFQGIFNDCIKLKNAHYFSLLVQALSNYVPFEKNIECLKVSIGCPLSLPLEYQSVYADYITLLKTRIKDLKPEELPEQTIEKVLLAFQEMGKIPPVVLEASLIQKHKFLNEFLPALLVPRIVPQIPDVREKFIKALDQMGKIPNNMLQKYRKACLQEEEKLLECIDITDDNSI